MCDVDKDVFPYEFLMVFAKKRKPISIDGDMFAAEVEFFHKHKQQTIVYMEAKAL